MNNLNNLLTQRSTALLLVSLFLMSLSSYAAAHGVTAGDKGYIQEISGPHIISFIYLGAKHMVTGYDHLLFLFGVIFFLYKLSHVTLYVSLFALGHVITLLAGVYFDLKINAYFIDAIIGFSVIYKALDNLGAFKTWFNVQPSTKISTFIFGLCHGFGLATKVLDYELSQDGLIINLISFNIGVEFGQILALWLMLIVINLWRKSNQFYRYAYFANTTMIMLGFLLMGYQISSYFLIS